MIDPSRIFSARAPVEQVLRRMKREAGGRSIYTFIGQPFKVLTRREGPKGDYWVRDWAVQIGRLACGERYRVYHLHPSGQIEAANVDEVEREQEQKSQGE